MGTTKEKTPKQGLTSASDLPMELPVGRESPYHRLDSGWMLFLFFVFEKKGFIIHGLNQEIMFFFCLQLVFITFYVLCVLQSWLSISTAIKSM